MTKTGGDRAPIGKCSQVHPHTLASEDGCPKTTLPWGVRGTALLRIGAMQEDDTQASPSPDATSTGASLSSILTSAMAPLWTLHQPVLSAHRIGDVLIEFRTHRSKKPEYHRIAP